MSILQSQEVEILEGRGRLLGRLLLEYFYGEMFVKEKLMEEKEHMERENHIKMTGVACLAISKFALLPAVLALSGAIMPPLDNFPSKLLPVQLDKAEDDSSDKDAFIDDGVGIVNTYQVPTIISNGQDNFHTMVVEPKTAFQFPTILYPDTFTSQTLDTSVQYESFLSSRQGMTEKISADMFSDEAYYKAFRERSSKHLQQLMKKWSTTFKDQDLPSILKGLKGRGTQTDVDEDFDTKVDANEAFLSLPPFKKEKLEPSLMQKIGKLQGSIGP